MRQTTIRCIVACAALATALSVAETHAAANRRGNVDMNHSTVGFSVPILGGLSQVSGKFSGFWADIELREDEDGLAIDRITAVIEVETIDTGIVQRDIHLRARDFFDARNHPEIRFESDRITKDGERYTAHGTLTMRGVSKDIALPITVTGQYRSEKSGRINYGFTAALTLNRDEFGISYRHDNPVFIGTDVQVTLNILTRSLEL